MEEFNKPLTVRNVVPNRNFSSAHKKKDTTNTSCIVCGTFMLQASFTEFRDCLG